MREAGMDRCYLDAIGNVVGRYEGDAPGLPCLMLGSHLDTVRNAGKYDGMLGVLAAIDCVRSLTARGKRLPFALEVVGFADEEGVRFGSTLLGSRAVAGTFDKALLDKHATSGTSDARSDDRRSGSIRARSATPRQPADVLAYAELHIEQGPVLEAEGLPVGVVTAINGANRFVDRHQGHGRPRRHGADDAAPRRARRRRRMRAGDRGTCAARAGTRRHRRCAGSQPGRDQRDSRSRAVHDRRARPRDEQRARRGGRRRWPRSTRSARRATSASPSTRCTRAMSRAARNGCRSRSRAAIAAEGIAGARPAFRARATTAWRSSTSVDIGMLFVRCKGGISHNPLEAITVEDAELSARVFLRFIENFEPKGKSIAGGAAP